MATTEHGVQRVPRPDVQVQAGHLSMMRSVLADGGLVLLLGGAGTGKTALAQALAETADATVTVVDVDPYMEDIVGVPDGPVVVACLAGSGDRHEFTAAVAARVGAHRLPDFVLYLVRGADGRPRAAGGGYVRSGRSTHPVPSN